MKNQIINKIKEEKIIAIIRGVYGDDCVKLGKLLADNGIHLMEVTFDMSKEDNTPTLSAIKRLSSEVDNVFVGAGTVTNLDYLNKAIDNGAKFIVSPDCNEEVIKETVSRGLVSLPGATTPTEVMQCVRAGADFVKLFPIGSFGAGYLKAVKAPLSSINLLAVGGVNEKNAGEFIKDGACGVGVGCVANKALIKDGKWDELEKLIKELKQSVNF